MVKIFGGSIRSYLQPVMGIRKCCVSLRTDFTHPFDILHRVSYCGFSTLLEDGLALQLEMNDGNCTLKHVADPLTTNRLARLIWAVASSPPGLKHLIGH